MNETVPPNGIESAAVPDVTDTSYQSQMAALGEHAQSSFNEVLAQYRFLGLLAGFPGPNDGPNAVSEARAAIIEALGDFLEAGPLAGQVSSAFDSIRRSRDALQEQIFTQMRSADGDFDGALRAQQLLDRVVRGHPSNQSETYLEQLASGAYDERFAADVANLPPEYQSAFTDLIAKNRELAGLEDSLRGQRRAAIVNWFSGLWNGVKKYYNDNMALIQNGQWLLATGRIAIDAAIFAAEEIIVSGIVAAVVGLTGGLALGMALALRSAVRLALNVVKQGSRTVRNVRAAYVFRITLNKIEPGMLTSNRIPLNATSVRRVDYEKVVDVEVDLTPNERRAVGEGGQGSTVRDPDASEQGTGGNGTPEDPPASRHPRDGDTPRSNEALLRDGRVPFNRRDPSVFQDWWDDLSYDELRQLSTDEDILPQINSGIRGNGGQHEWLKVSQQLEHKRLGFSMREIQDWVTATGVAEGPLPRPTAAGATRWRHNPEGGGAGSGVGSRTMHNALEGLYTPPARSRSEFLRRMGYFANSYIEGGIDGLPSGLRDAIQSTGGG